MRAALVAELAAGAGMLWAQINIRALGPADFTSIMLGSVALGLGAFTFECLSVRCPDCGARWMWMAVRRQSVGQWLRWLTTLSACPTCGMPKHRWLEFHDSVVLAVDCTPHTARVDIDAYVHQWEGRESARRGTGWMQRLQVEVGEPVVAHLPSGFPCKLTDGCATPRDSGGLTLPTTLDGPVVLDLETTSGEHLLVSGRQLRTHDLAEPRFVEELPPDMDPEVSTH